MTIVPALCSPHRIVPETVQTFIDNATRPLAAPDYLPGLLVRVSIQCDRAGMVQWFLVDFTTHNGRRAIAETAQWAMSHGYTLETRPIKGD